MRHVLRKQRVRRWAPFLRHQQIRGAEKTVKCSFLPIYFDLRNKRILHNGEIKSFGYRGSSRHSDCHCLRVFSKTRATSRSHNRLLDSHVYSDCQIHEGSYKLDACRVPTIIF